VRGNFGESATVERFDHCGKFAWVKLQLTVQVLGCKTELHSSLSKKKRAGKYLLFCY
jgi:hypothetical protein